MEYYIREAVIEQLDDIEDLCIAEKRWSGICAGKSETMPIEEITRRIGIKD